MKSKLKAPGTQRLKLKYDKLHSSFAFKFNSRRYNKAAAAVGAIARNCSGELEALYFKFKKKKHARDELQEVGLNG